MSGIIGVAQAANNLASVLSGGLLAPLNAAGLGPWAATLQRASWRGLPFAVKASRIQRGRRVAIHDYAFRDTVWVEDLGRGRRSVSFRAFLIGDSVYAQRDAFSSACDVAGPGTLVHPSLGTLQAVNVEFAAGEASERGRVVELDLTFLEAGQDKPLYPSELISTVANVFGAGAAADLAAASDFLTQATIAVAYGESVLGAGVQTVLGFTDLVGSAVSDASLIAGAVTGIPGLNGGRYAAGSLTAPQPAGTTVATAIAALTVDRAQTAADVATALAAAITAIPAAIQVVVADVITTAVDPADQVRLLSGLAAYQPAVTASTAPIGGAIAAVQTAIGAICRRSALTALARATASYQPSSYNDAASVLDATAALFDAEILVAADAGDDGSYLAFRALRAAVSQDLIARGSLLPQLVTVRRNASLPSLTLAYQIYGDATRSDDLIARVNPPHPAFMPTEFQALSS